MGRDVLQIAIIMIVSFVSIIVILELIEIIFYKKKKKVQKLLFTNKFNNTVSKFAYEYISLLPDKDIYILDQIEESNELILEDRVSEVFKVQRFQEINFKIRMLLSNKDENSKAIIELIDNIYHDVLQIKYLVNMNYIDDKKERYDIAQNLDMEICDIFISTLPEYTSKDLDSRSKIIQLYNNYGYEINSEFVNRTVNIILNVQLNELSHKLLKLVEEQ